MNKKIKKLWLKALRSGEYRQTNGALRDNGGFCCLGVLCDIHQKKTKTGEWEEEGANIFYKPGPSCRRSEDVLPPAVVAWAGLEEDDPQVDTCADATDECLDSLSAINDNGASFERIAELIEKSL